MCGGGTRARLGEPGHGFGDVLRQAALEQYLKSDYNPDEDFLPPDLAKAAEAQLRGNMDY